MRRARKRRVSEILRQQKALIERYDSENEVASAKIMDMHGSSGVKWNSILETLNPQKIRSQFNSTKITTKFLHYLQYTVKPINQDTWKQVDITISKNHVLQILYLV